MITWTKEEEEKIIWSASWLLKKDSTLTTLQAIRQAQKYILPENRQRPVDAKSKVKKIINRIEALAEPKVEIVPVQAGINKNDIEKIVEEIFFKLSSPMVETISNAVTESIQNQFSNFMQSTLSNIYAGMKAASKQSEIEVKIKDTTVKSVLIVGMLPVQENEVKRDFESKINLCFYSAESNFKQIEHKAESVDHIIINGKFVSHALMNHFKGNKKVTVFHGGVSSLSRVLIEVEKGSPQIVNII